MPSLAKSNQSTKHAVFIPLLVLVFALWTVYRSVFRFPVVFDEVIGKAIFFGFPVWLYVSLTREKAIGETVSWSKFSNGVLLGIAFGGIFGFVTTLLAMIQGRTQVQAVELFTVTRFWWEFFLAFMTAFWETIFFFSFCMVVIQKKWPQWSLFQQVLVTASIFALFHVPNTLLRFDVTQAVAMSLLLFFFGLGQAFIFARRYNAFTVMVTHAFWGMVLLIHFGF